ncbi:unnamed protein product [Ilex paraguariensis]|uniref:Uncharacterized protein n=1 Tax=Ilex paraguariensis TaxID=185542 RepID=A0ABC8TI00_9AQUA
MSAWEFSQASLPSRVPTLGSLDLHLEEDEWKIAGSHNAHPQQDLNTNSGGGSTSPRSTYTESKKTAKPDNPPTLIVPPTNFRQTHRRTTLSISSPLLYNLVGIACNI